MEHLKLVNCPIRGLFPEKNGKIDWLAVGLDPLQIQRFCVQGENKAGDYVSLFEIADKAILLASGVIDKTNNNANPQDSAAIINAAEFTALKTEIEAIRATKKAAL